ncbi:hypothetical protein [Fodinicola acaciae]|uniref:hypothetical protein n=1 Tax=Fodinicola acaciae TaxID=2681555 RepID=UPI0013D54A34
MQPGAEPVEPTGVHVLGALHHGRFGFAALLEVHVRRQPRDHRTDRVQLRVREVAAAHGLGGEVQLRRQHLTVQRHARAERASALHPATGLGRGEQQLVFQQLLDVFRLQLLVRLFVLDRVHDIQHTRRGLAIFTLGVTQHRRERVRVFFRPWVTDWRGGGGRSGHGSNNTGHTDKTTPPTTSVDSIFPSLRVKLTSRRRRFEADGEAVTSANVFWRGTSYHLTGANFA